MTQAVLNTLVQQDQHAQLLRGMGWRFKTAPGGYTAKSHESKTVFVSRRALTGCPKVFRDALNSMYRR